MNISISQDEELPPQTSKPKVGQRHCLPNPRIETYDIVIVVNAAWQKSFPRVAYNKEAIAARGWNPLTRNLLDHPEILARKEPEQQPEERSVSQLKALISYKRRKTDSWQQPKSRAELLTKWEELKHRETPPPSPVRDEGDSSDEEEDLNINVEPV